MNADAEPIQNMFYQMAKCILKMHALITASVLYTDF